MIEVTETYHPLAYYGMSLPLSPTPAPSWRFRQMARADLNEDPMYPEFFAPEEGDVSALVREAIQNSLDARRAHEPVVVLIRRSAGVGTFGDMAWLYGLGQHLHAQGVADLPLVSEPVELLHIEDFHTRGLGGDPSQSNDLLSPALSEKNDFYYFWRNVGRSVKHATERGRWGLGKSVYSSSSRILSFFGYTVRASDGRHLLMGQSVGKVHHILEANEAVRYHAYGYFGDFSDDGFSLPFENTELLSAFLRETGLSRKSEPGLSITIPFPHREMNARAITQEVIRNWYIPVIRGDLVVEVSDQQGHFLIDQQHIRRVLQNLEWKKEGGISRESMLGLLDFATRALALPASARLTSATIGEIGKPDITADVFAQDAIKYARQQLENGETVACLMPILVRKGESTESSCFSAYLERDESVDHGIGEFVRQGLTISQISRPPRASYRGLVLVDDLALSTILGDSENPAHTKWQERSQKIRAYRYGSSTVRCVAGSLQKLSEIFSAPADGLERDLLSDVFFIEEPSEDRSPPKRRREPKPDGASDPPTIPESSRPRPFAISRIHEGVRIKSSHDAIDIPKKLRIEFAYDVRSGNAFAKYLPFDFVVDRSPIRVSVSGVQITQQKYNTLEVVPVDIEFTVEVIGFDPRRDLVVRVREIAREDDE